MTCTSCAADLDDLQIFCDRCGTPQATTPCRSCGQRLAAAATFCDRCGGRQEAALEVVRPPELVPRPEGVLRPEVVASPVPVPVGAVSEAHGLCVTCGRSPGARAVCESCRQITGMPAGVTLSTPGRRFAGYLLDGFLFMITLGIGWLIWIIVFSARHGQSPAKQLLRMRVLRLQGHRVAGWGTMFVREVIYKFVVGALTSFFTLGVGFFVFYGWLLWDKNDQQLWDKMGATLVVNDPRSALK